jgi:CRISPR type III-A-associated protein Csm2
LWPSYLNDGYFDSKGNLNDDLVRRKRVEALVQEMARDCRDRNDPKLVNHQLRRFFQHARAIEARLKAGRTTWAEEAAAFAMLDVAAADAYGKTSKKIPRLFHDFIKRNVSAVKTEKDFLRGFLPHFEALVGFGAAHLSDSERN